jgi:hypothetical protein
MNNAVIHKILSECTVQLRKGAAVTESDVGAVHVTEVFDAPHESESDGLTKVDVHFVTIGVDRAKADAARAALADELASYPNGLDRGPSYIEVGAELGDQGAALSLFGLGQVLGFWKVITPEALGITGDRARQLAGSGFVMCSGFTP